MTWLCVNDWVCIFRLQQRRKSAKSFLDRVVELTQFVGVFHLRQAFRLQNLHPEQHPGQQRLLSHHWIHGIVRRCLGRYTSDVCSKIGLAFLMCRRKIVHIRTFAFLSNSTTIFPTCLLPCNALRAFLGPEIDKKKIENQKGAALPHEASSNPINSLVVETIGVLTIDDSWTKKKSILKLQ